MTDTIPAPGLTDNNAYGMEYRPSLKERMTKRLGFRRAFQVRPIEDAIWPSYFVSRIRIRLSILDRLRVLITGRIEVENVHQTDVEVKHANTLTSIGIPY